MLGGPAPQPLSAILLEHDKASDHLYAVGTLGGEMFDAFFAKYEFKLALEYGDKRARQPVSRQRGRHRTAAVTAVSRCNVDTSGLIGDDASGRRAT